jgi:hypothetical protein
MSRVIPPFNFAMVEAGVYRSAYPIDMNYLHVKSLNLKSILCLRPKIIESSSLPKLCSEEGIVLFEADVGDNIV